MISGDLYIVFAKFVAAIIIGYLLGSIPFGVLLARRYAKLDVRKYGSGKIGAANVLRTVGRKPAAMVAILDIIKGMLAVVFAWLIVDGDYLVVNGLGALSAEVLAALAAIAGHNWSVFLKFQGGRGVSTYFGGLVALCPQAALAAIFGGEIIVIGAGLTRYVSLGSIAGVVGSYAVLVPLTVMNGFPIEYLFYALAGAIIIFVMHRDNIVRLVMGKERKLGEKAGRLAPPSGRAGGVR
jgi:glycerol-3-phosphate acyltransferase PlsY